MLENHDYLDERGNQKSERAMTRSRLTILISLAAAVFAIAAWMLLAPRQESSLLPERRFSLVPQREFSLVPERWLFLVQRQELSSEPRPELSPARES